MAGLCCERKFGDLMGMMGWRGDDRRGEVNGGGREGGGDPMED